MINQVHFIWLGSNTISTPYQKGLQSFYTKHPTWSVNLWFQTDLHKIIRNSKYDIHRFSSFINRYNFIKYHILAEYGGWFVDMDIVWNKNLDNIIADKTKRSIPQLIVPVRTHPFSAVDTKSNDDMLIYADKVILWDLIDYCESRNDYDTSLKYEPYGPVSLSRWLHSTDYIKEYLYESEIQNNGYYCDHRNLKSWEFT